MYTEFKNGNGVIIKSKYELEDEFGEDYMYMDPTISPSMYQYLGNKTRIYYIDYEDPGGVQLYIDDTEYYWNIAWLKPIPKIQDKLELSKKRFKI